MAPLAMRRPVSEGGHAVVLLVGGALVSLTPLLLAGKGSRRDLLRRMRSGAGGSPHGLATSTSLSGAPSLHPVRTLIVPRQLKAYGGTFSRSIGERVDEKIGALVLQSLSPSRTAQSPLLSKPVKTTMVESFADMLITPALQAALTNMGVTTPSPIQQSAIEVVLQRKNTVIAAPHGEGKTLAFLLPLYQNMVKDRDVYRIPLRERRPRLILLAPTKELVEQLQAVCAQLDAATGLASVCFTSRKRSKYHLSRLLKQSMADVLVMDPKLVLRLVRKRRLFIDDLRYFVVDEADAMLSAQHDHDAVQLLMKVQKRNQFRYLWPVQTQYIFSTAYMTRKVEHLIGRRVSDTVTCMFRQAMHRPPTRLRHRFYPIRQEPEKFSVLLHLLRKNGHVQASIDTDTAEREAHTNPRKLSGSLAEWHDATKRRSWPQQEQADRQEAAQGCEQSTAVPAAPVATLCPHTIAETDDYRNDAYARCTLERVRPLQWGHLTTVAAPFACPIARTVFAEGRRTIIFFDGIDAATAVFHQLRSAGFVVSLLHASLPYKVRKDMYADFASGRSNVLCATDVAARGLDLHVDTVINFDVPTNALTYLSRCGRTARMGREGQVLSLYRKQQGVIVAAVKAFLQKHQPLEGLTNHKPDMMQPRYAEWRTHKINALARSYVSLLTRKTIPAHLERTYVHHNATWRPVFHPQTTGMHGGVAPRQQQKVMDRIREQAVWYRRGQLARRKGGRAKFGRRTMQSGVWNDIGGVASRAVSNEEQNPHPAGLHFGPPNGPPP